MSKDNRKVRFSDAKWASPAHHIIVGGAGGIGSWAAMFLARIGHMIYLYDMDVIDETNIGGQLYGTAQIGTNKAVATAENIKTFCGHDAPVYTYDKFTKADGMVAPIMFSCFDNMHARKIMFEKWAEQEEREVFVDGRMLAEVGNVFLVQKGQEEEYRKFLFDDSEVEEAPCSFKATSHCGALTGSMMVSALNNYLTNKVTGFNDRIVNFKTDFELPMLSIDGYEFIEKDTTSATVDKDRETASKTSKTASKTEVLH